MHRFPMWPLALVLASCQPLADGLAPVSRRPSAASNAVHVTSSTGPGVAPVASPTGLALPTSTPVAALAAAPLVLLGRPPGASRALACTIAIDAAYAVASGAGKIVANAGGAPTLHVGAGLVSEGGASVISQGGGTLVSKARFALLQATAPAAGTVLPVGGMALRAYDMPTGRAVSLGVDPAGTPVFDVATDALGHVDVYLPAGGTTNIRLFATALGGTDDRLTYSVIVSANSVAETVDEDTAQVSSYIRAAYTGRLLDRMRLGSNLAATQDVLLNFPVALRHSIQERLDRFDQAVVAAGFAGLAPDAQRRGAEAISDAVLAHVRFVDAVLDPRVPYDGPKIGALAALTSVVKALRERVTAKMVALAAAGQDPTAYFEARPTMRMANAGRAEPLLIKKPSDYNAMIVQAFVGNGAFTDAERSDLITRALYDTDVGVSNEQGVLYQAAMGGLSLAIAQALYVGDQRVLEDQLAAIARND